MQGDRLTAGGGAPAASSPEQWLERLREWALALGFSQIGVAGVDLASAEPGLLAWLEAGFAGGMDYMPRHGLRRARPAELVPGTVRVVTARMDYLGPPMMMPLRPSRSPARRSSSLIGVPISTS